MSVNISPSEKKKSVSKATQKEITTLQQVEHVTSC